MSVEQVAPAGDISSSHAAADMPDAEAEVRAVESDPTRRYSRVGIVLSGVAFPQSGWATHPTRCNAV